MANKLTGRSQYDALGNLAISTQGGELNVPGLMAQPTDLSGVMNSLVDAYGRSLRGTASGQARALEQPLYAAPQPTQQERFLDEAQFQAQKRALQPTQNYMWQRTAQGQPELVRTQQGIENLGPMEGGLTQTAQMSEAQARAAKTLSPLEEQRLRAEKDAYEKATAWSRG